MATAAQEAENDGVLMTDEIRERVIGSVDKDVYLLWAKAGGGKTIALLILLMFAVVEILNVVSKWW